MKFAHMGDCHLGGWRQPELAELNARSFQYAIETCIQEKVDFVLIAGDLFDSAYPPIETLKEAFGEFKKLKDANIPVFLIAGSHDYSAAGRTFLDVLEKAGLATNAHKPEERHNYIYLHPTIYKNVAVYGYPGKKSALEVQEIERIKLHDAPGLFQILMLHTALRDAVGNLPIPAVDQDKLPKVHYTALAHLHVRYNKNGRVYCGPLFPNNQLEFEELGGGSFCIADTKGKVEVRQVRLKEVQTLDIELKNALVAKDTILQVARNASVKDKIVILKLKGVLEVGEMSDIPFAEIEREIRRDGAYTVLRNTSRLYAREAPSLEALPAEDIEDAIIDNVLRDRKSKFKHLAKELISTLVMEKKEDEKTQIFEDRILGEVKKVLAL